MNYLKFTKDDMLNGRGVRLTLWVAGCNHECPKCQNPETWSINGGVLFDLDAFFEMVFTFFVFILA